MSINRTDVLNHVISKCAIKRELDNVGKRGQWRNNIKFNVWSFPVCLVCRYNNRLIYRESCKLFITLKHVTTS